MRVVTALTTAFAIACAAGSCGGPDQPADDAQVPGRAPARDSPPVPLDADPPVTYPPDLYEQGVSGTVVLRLFVTEDGAVVPDSTRLEESSGIPGLDSAALAAAPQLRYAPALRGGRAVASPFRQPIHFRPPGGGEPSP